MASKSFYWNKIGQKITHWGCKDCGQLKDMTYTLRPSGKFCDARCREYVLTVIKPEYIMEKFNNKEAK